MRRSCFRKFDRTQNTEKIMFPETGSNIGHETAMFPETESNIGHETAMFPEIGSNTEHKRPRCRKQDRPQDT